MKVIQMGGCVRIVIIVLMRGAHSFKIVIIIADF